MSSSPQPHLPTLREIDAELSRRSLAEFIRQAWPILEPATGLVWNWHIDAIAEHLEAVRRREIRRLIINIPPRHMKSLICSVFFPAWVWLHSPAHRFLTSSYDGRLSTRDAVKSRDVLLSPWYQETFRPEWRIKADTNVKSWYENDETGYRLAISTASGATGHGGDTIIVDDPLNKRDRHSEAARTASVEHVKTVLPGRLNDKKTGAIIVVMQRLHEGDPTGALLEMGGWEHLCLPSEFEEERRCSTSIGWSDPREQSGDLLFEDRLPAEVLEEDKENLGPEGYAGEHQQRPAPAEGNIFKSWRLQFWWPTDKPEPLPYTVRTPTGTAVACKQIELPANLDLHWQSWDMAFKDKRTSAFVVGQEWASCGVDSFLLDQIRDKLDVVGSCDAVRALSEKWPQTGAILIEDKASGPAVVQTLKNEIPGLKESGVEGDKVSRAYAAEPMFGNIYLPHPSLFPWVNDLIGELLPFPNTTYKDQVDSLTQAIIWRYLKRKKVKMWKVNADAGHRGRKWAG